MASPATTTSTAVRVLSILNGGDGTDAATYGGRAAPVTVTLDNQANDGEAGEGDNVPAATSRPSTAATATTR